MSVLWAQGVRMGLSASPQVAWIKTDASRIKNNGAVFGFNFGLNTDFFFAERYSFTTGITINNTGGNLVYSDTTELHLSDGTYTLLPNSNVRYHIQYLDVPLAFKMESNQIGYFVYYAQFGVTNHFRVGANADISSLGLDGSGCKDEIPWFNMSYHIGSGVNYYFSKNTALSLGLIYSNGFIDATSNDGKAISDKASLQSLSLRVGVIF
jgi:opacity protein-like surface antigen